MGIVNNGNRLLLVVTSHRNITSISNTLVFQGEVRRSKKTSFTNSLVLPLLLYQDDFETNNPSGCHKGIEKVGGIYVFVSCIFPHMHSKAKYIFMLMLYKTTDTKFLSSSEMFREAVKEFQFLKEKGITILTPQDL